MPTYSSMLCLLVNKDSPRKKRLKAQLRNVQKRLTAQNRYLRKQLQKSSIIQPSKNQCLNMLSKFFTGATYKFLKTQVTMSSRSPYGRRWSASDKAIALSIYHASPKALQILSRLFILPTVETIKQSIRNLNIYPGVCVTMLNAFKSEITYFGDQEKLCTIAFDEMKLRPGLSYDQKRDVTEGSEDLGMGTASNGLIADHALVFEVRGLFSNWKQPFSYHLTNSTVKKHSLRALLTHIVKNLIDLGLNPKAIVCDQGANNRACLQGLFNVSTEKPYIELFDHQIFCFYDVPHLLKNVRNNLKDSGYKNQDGKKISWSHIEEFSAQDSKLPIRQAPKLTAKHLKLPGFTRMNVRLAAQTLSHSVAKGICLMASLGVLPENALLTAEFCDIFDSLFNVFNSRTSHSPRRYNYGISMQSEHWVVIEKAENYIQSLRPMNSKSQPCLNGWLQNITALRLLFQSVSPPMLLTHRLNQDCVENLFSQIRGRGRFRDHPDPQNFRAAFRDVLVDELLTVSSKSNCREDMDEKLFGLESLGVTNEVGVFSVENLAVTENSEVPHTADEPTAHIEITDHDYNVAFSTSEMDAVLEKQAVNVLTYIGGFVVRRCKDAVCSTCASVMLTEVDSHNSSHQFLVLKNYEHVKPGKGLTAPSRPVVSLLQVAESAFNHHIDQYVRHPSVKSNMLRALLAACEQEFYECDCNSRAEMLKLFLNIRFFHSLRLFNRDLSESAEKRKSRKHIKLSS